MNQPTGCSPDWTARHEVLYGAQLSALYHQKRARFYDWIDKTVTCIAIIGGATALSQIWGTLGDQIAAAVITATSTINLVAGIPDKCRRHSELASQFRQLEAAIEARGRMDFTEADVAQWSARRVTLEAGEPAALPVLVLICQNELASLYHAQRTRVVWWRSVLGQIFAIPAA